MKLKYKKQLLNFAMQVGENMLINGAETYRVADTMVRICSSRKLNHISAYVTPTCIMISEENYDGVSFMKTVKILRTDLNKVSELNDLSRKFVNDLHMNIYEAKQKLNSIVKQKHSYSNIVYYLATGIGSTAFVLLSSEFNLINIFFTFFVSMISSIIYKNISQKANNNFLATLMSSTFISVVALILFRKNIISDPSFLIVGSIMPLLPGSEFVKSLRELISGDLVSGVSRLVNACITAFVIAAGVIFSYGIL